MRNRWSRLFLGLFGITLLALGVFATAISHNSPCQAPPQGTAPADGGMMAVLQRCYGDPGVLSVERVAKPQIAEDEVLIRVHAAGVNPLDKHYLHGTPYLLRLSNGFGAPEDPRTGVDMAGVIEAVGAKVTGFKAGDAVFGGVSGAFAEYVGKKAANGLALKPASLSFEQAAAIPIAGVTALQALRDKGKLQAGQHVLINGASGGVGSYAVQIAKAMGARVTGVCSTSNVAMVRALGADAVIDYTQQNYTESAERYDVIVDMVGSQTLTDSLKVLKPDGALVLVGSAQMNNWWGPLDRPLRAKIMSMYRSERIEPMLASLGSADLAQLAKWADAGLLRSEIEARYPLAQAGDALRHMESGRTRGKVILSVLP